MGTSLARFITTLFLAALLVECARPSANAPHERAPSPSPSATVLSEFPALPTSNSCLASAFDLRNPKPLHMQANQLKDYLASYTLAPVRDLRTAFDQYQAGRADADTQRNLEPYGAALVSDGFYVLSLQGSLAGGNFILVQFHHHPHAEYNIWLYKLGGKTPSVRMFQQFECSPAEQKWIKTTYEALMALGDDLSLAKENPPPGH